MYSRWGLYAVKRSWLPLSLSDLINLPQLLLPNGTKQEPPISINLSLI